MRHEVLAGRAQCGQSVPVTSCTNESFPRPLSERERSVLTALLVPDFPGADELRAQLPGTVVTGGRCPQIDLAVPQDVPRSPAADGCLPVQGNVDTAEHAVQQIILFVRDGRLDSLETWWIDGDAPSEWPPVDHLEICRWDPR